METEVDIFGTAFWFVFTTLLHLVTFLAVCVHALYRRRNPSATILWIFVAWSFPFVGALLYLAFGVDRVPRKGMKKQEVNQKINQERDERHRGEQSAFILEHFKYRVDSNELKLPFLQTLNKAIDRLNPDHPLLDRNQIAPLISGDGAYPEMMKAIASATHHIHMQSFIIGNDKIGKEFLDALKAKAEEGVQVRLLFDRFGSTSAYLKGFFRAYRNIPNMQVEGWTQANPFKRQFQINLRNHRKNLIVDGRIAFFGGVNIAEENVSRKGAPAIRDYHFQVEGPMVHELQYSFLSDWYFMTEESIDRLLLPEHFPKIQVAGSAQARIIDTGPSQLPGMLGEIFFNAISLAREQVIIVTPYFVPSADLIRAIRAVARRGVEVRIVLPEENNHRYAGLASKALYEELLEAGVRIFHRKPPFIHAKAMLIDNTVAFVGTSNLDIRSLELNYETTVLVEEEMLVFQIKEMMLEDVAQSTEVHLNEWLGRSNIQKLKENICILMSPVL